MSMIYMFDMEPVNMDTVEGIHYQFLILQRNALLVWMKIDRYDELVDSALEEVLATRYGKIGVKQ